MDPIRASKRIREHKKDAVQQRKALFRLLVKELRVMSGEAIVPTYKIPALARPPEGQVVLIERCANRPNPTVRAQAIVAR